MRRQALNKYYSIIALLLVPIILGGSFTLSLRCPLRDSTVTILYDTSIKNIEEFIHNLRNILVTRGYNTNIIKLNLPNLHYATKCSRIVIVIAHSLANGELLIDNTPVPQRIIITAIWPHAKWILISCNNPASGLIKILEERSLLLYASPPVTLLRSSLLSSIFYAVFSYVEPAK